MQLANKLQEVIEIALYGHSKLVFVRITNMKAK